MINGRNIVIFLSVSVLLVMALVSSWRWGTESLPFSRQAWLDDVPSGSRFAMARYIVNNQSLRGMSEAEVKELLGFNIQKQHVAVIPLKPPGKILQYHVSGRMRFALLYVYLNNGTVEKTVLTED